MRRLFVLTPLFEEALKSRPRFDEILNRVELEILKNPKAGDVIQGTGGVRKLRLEDTSRGRGKRGGLRILFLDLPHVERTHLLYIYDKANADDLSPEGKKIVKILVDEIKGEDK